MFDSGMSAKDFISRLKEEVDVALPISDDSYIGWLNSVEQFIYGSVIKEEGIYKDESAEDIPLPINIDGENKVRIEDVVAVYGVNAYKRVQLLYVTVANRRTWKDVYYSKGDKLCARPGFPYERVEIVYVRRPIEKTKENYSDCNVMIPIEFTELIASKLRGEAYKLANEDSIASKWLNDYNALLQDFTAWYNVRRAQVGV